MSDMLFINQQNMVEVNSGQESGVAQSRNHAKSLLLHNAW